MHALRVTRQGRLACVAKPSLQGRGITAAAAAEGARWFGPAARRLLDEYALDSHLIGPSGPHGLLLKSDVLAHIANSSLKKPVLVRTAEAPTSKPSSAPAGVSPADAAYTDLPLTNMRKTIAKRLSHSKATIPHSYSSASVNLTEILKQREEFKVYNFPEAEGVAGGGTKLSVNDFIVKACAMSLQRVGEVNVQYVDEGFVRRQTSSDVAIAVATDGGLITPIVREAHLLGMDQLSLQIRELSTKAKSNSLQPNEFQGGTFTVSNLGMFGISQFTAIINPPQAAILAVGGGKTVLNSENSAAETWLNATLCFDVRAIDPADAARFLADFKSLLENPEILLL